MDYLHEICSQSVFVKFAAKLPYHLKTRRVRKVHHIRRKGCSPDFGSLIEFIDTAAEEANDPIYGQIVRKTNDKSRSRFQFEKKQKERQALSFTTTAQECKLCEDNHNLFGCDKVKKLLHCINI